MISLAIYHKHLPICLNSSIAFEDEVENHTTTTTTTTGGREGTRKQETSYDVSWATVNSMFFFWYCFHLGNTNVLLQYYHHENAPNTTTRQRQRWADKRVQGNKPKRHCTTSLGLQYIVYFFLVSFLSR